jgi:hypothetical protein
MMYFNENHKWKDVMWFEGCSPEFPSNLGLSKGNLVGIGGYLGSR